MYTDMTKKERKWYHLHETANAAGMVASEAHTPEPMYVTGHAPGEEPQTWKVDGGVCGFAWVEVRPGTSSFARFAKKHLRAYKGYRGGIQIWCPLPTQSMTTKQSYCRAYAKVLADEGIKAYAGSRMD